MGMLMGHRRGPQYDWKSAQIIDRLAAAWMVGKSTADIGLEFGITKNAVVGKVHREFDKGDTRFAARPSPIKRDPDKPRKPPKPEPLLARPSLAVLPSLAMPEMLPAWLPSTAAVEPVEPPRVQVIAPPPAPQVQVVIPPPPPRPVVVYSKEKCQFPTGHSPRIRFDCENPVRHRRPYCDDHSGDCYTRTMRNSDGEEGESRSREAAA